MMLLILKPAQIDLISHSFRNLLPFIEHAHIPRKVRDTAAFDIPFAEYIGPAEFPVLDGHDLAESGMLPVIIPGFDLKQINSVWNRNSSGRNRRS